MEKKSGSKVGHEAKRKPGSLCGIRRPGFYAIIRSDRRSRSDFVLRTRQSQAPVAVGAVTRSSSGFALDSRTSLPLDGGDGLFGDELMGTGRISITRKVKKRGPRAALECAFT